jgi:vesicle coat complex subunit
MEKAKETPGGGAVYFTNTKNSELSELVEDLDSMKIDQQKDAMKQIIAGMTLGKDVSSLFPYVVKSMRTTNIELKKLIYLYIINYAKTKPDQAILAVNAFHQDATDRNSPLIRALAVRTMGCIQVDMIVTYLCETLKLSLKDEDAYVRKTACVCVAKLYNTCPSLVSENGFINILESLVTDGNSMVVANAVVALAEISLLSSGNYLKNLLDNKKILKRILTALPEANEWGQVYILDVLVTFQPQEKVLKRSEEIIEAVLPRLTHANPAVVMSAIKVILKFLDYIENVEHVRNYSKKISNSLMTVINSGSEIHYLLLRSMHAIVQKRPNLLDKEFRYFFILYTDPVYIKIEKMDILYKLADSKNYEYLLAEFRTYACLEFDTEIVKKAVEYLGKIAFKYEKAAELCLDHLKDILDNNKDFTVNGGIIILRDLIRKYKCAKSIDLIKKIDEDFIKYVTLPDSKAALMYIIGENCNLIKNSTSLLSPFVDNFNGENEKVKLQILNAVIKNFVNKPEEGEEIVKLALQKGGEETINPDVRDRAYIYWRLLEIDPDAAKEIILSEKPSFEIQEEKPMESKLVDDIIINLTNVSAIYHKLSSEIITQEDLIKEEEESQQLEESEEKIENKKKNKKIKENKVNKADIDLLGLGEDTFPQPTDFKNSPKNNYIFDMFGNSSGDANSNEFGIEFISKENNQDIQVPVIFDSSTGVNSPAAVECLDATKNGLSGSCGVSIWSAFHRENKSIKLGIYIKNNTQYAMNNFMLYIEKNSFGLALDPSDFENLGKIVINSEKSKTFIANLIIDNDRNSKIPPNPDFKLKVLLKSNIDDFAFETRLLLNVLLTENGKMTNNVFLPFYRQYLMQKVNFKFLCKISEEAALNRIFERNNIYEVAKNNKTDPPQFYYSALVSNSIQLVLEVSFPKGNIMLKFN